MTDLITITGVIGTDPELRTVRDNLSRLTMRVATSERKRNAEGKWHDAHTNWYNVTAFGKLADNAHASLRKGQRIVCVGKLRLQSFERENGSFGTRVEVVANNLGPDLVTQQLQPRTVGAPAASADQSADNAPGAQGWSDTASVASITGNAEQFVPDHQGGRVLEPTF